MPSRAQVEPQERAVALLRQVGFLHELPEPELRALGEIARGSVVPAGEVIFEEGASADVFHLVFRGSVELVRGGEAGEEERVDVRGSGQPVGAAALLESGTYPATARTLEATQLMSFTGDDLRRAVGDGTFAERVLRLLPEGRESVETGSSAESGPPDRAEGGGGGLEDRDAVSRAILRTLLPQGAPRVSGYDLAAGTTSEPNGRGDTVWGFLELADGRTALFALGAEGEELPPAHHLGVVRAALLAVAIECSDVRELLQRANHALAGPTEGVDRSVECGVLVPGDGHVDWSSAGRMAAGLIRRDGTFEEMGSEGPPLGMMEGFHYGSREVPVGAGDVFLVVSGVSTGVFRGATDLVAQVHGRTAGDIVGVLHRAIRKAHPDGVCETSVLFARRH